MLQTEVLAAGAPQHPKKLRPRLRCAVGQRVTAAQIRDERVPRTGQRLDLVRLAWAPAVFEVVAVAEEAAEDAALHAEHGRVLVQCDLHGPHGEGPEKLHRKRVWQGPRTVLLGPLGQGGPEKRNKKKIRASVRAKYCRLRSSRR